MIIAKCNLNQLIQLEDIFFSIEWNENPHIPPFAIQCDNDIYYYKIDKILNKYRIITK